MKYEPKVLINRTNHEVEFMCGGQTYIHPKGEVKPYDGLVAYHALKEANTGLEEYTKEVEDEIKSSGEKPRPAYDAWPWTKLVSEASKKKLFEPGMGRKDVIKALENA